MMAEQVACYNILQRHADLVYVCVLTDAILVVMAAGYGISYLFVVRCGCLSRLFLKLLETIQMCITFFLYFFLIM